MLIEDGSVYLFSDSFKQPSLYQGKKSERPDGLTNFFLINLLTDQILKNPNK